MRTKKIQTILKETEGLASFIKTVVAAGGAASSFTPSCLNKMSALDLITKVCGKNNIRFVFKRKEIDEEM